MIQTKIPLNANEEDSSAPGTMTPSPKKTPEKVSIEVPAVIQSKIVERPIPLRVETLTKFD